MSKLPLRARALVEEARKGYGPPAGSKQRVARALSTTLAAMSAAGSAGAATGKAAAGGGSSLGPPSSTLPGIGAKAFGWKLVLPLVVGVSASGAVGYELFGAQADAPQPSQTVARSRPVASSRPSVSNVMDSVPLPGSASAPVPKVESPRTLRRGDRSPKRSLGSSGHVVSLRGTTPAPKASMRVASAVPDLEEPSGKSPLALRSELRILREASAALRRGEPAEALKALDRHRSEFPEAVLRMERRALRVLALCAQGDIERGTRARDNFLRTAAESPMAHRVRAACERGKR